MKEQIHIVQEIVTGNPVAAYLDEDMANARAAMFGNRAKVVTIPFGSDIELLIMGFKSFTVTFSDTRIDVREHSEFEDSVYSDGQVTVTAKTPEEAFAMACQHREAATVRKAGS